MQRMTDPNNTPGKAVDSLVIDRAYTEGLKEALRTVADDLATAVGANGSYIYITEENNLPESVAWIRLSKLNKREVDTPGGTKVATIGDIILGEQGNITGFALSRVFVEGPIEKNGTIPRGAVIDTGSEDGVMTIDLTKAENPDAIQTAPTEPPISALPEPAAEPTTDPEIEDPETDHDATA